MGVKKGVMIGMIYGLVLSFGISFVFMFAGQWLAGGITSLFGEIWLYYATTVPFVLAFALLGSYFVKREQISNKNLWLLSLGTAFAVTLYSGTIGALFGEYMARGGSLRTYSNGGYTGVNVEGVLVWGTIYAFILLPLTAPVARLCIQLFVGLLKKYKIAS